MAKLTKAQREVRMNTANSIIRVIAAYGRRFFSQDADHRERMENPRISHFILKNGRLWFVDRYKGSEVYVCYEGRWRGFSEGGTLRSLVEHLRDYILGKTDSINTWHFGPWRPELCGGDLWGYGADMERVREEIATLLDQQPQTPPSDAMQLGKADPAKARIGDGNL